MKPTKNPTCRDDETLESSLFSRRRFHQVGNRPDDTLEQWQRRERRLWTITWIVAIISTPALIALFWYIRQTYGPREPLPFRFVIAFFPLMIASVPSCMMILLFSFMRPRETRGRWVIFGDGIFYRYGKSPHRYVPFSSIRRIRVKMPESGFACVIFDTDTETLRISERMNDDRKWDREFLPFLNLLIERLERFAPEKTGMKKLFELRQIIRRRIVSSTRFRYGDCLIMAAYFIPLTLMIPLFSFLQNIEYPMICWSVLAVCLFVLALGWLFNSFVQRWKNRKIDRLLESLNEK